MIDAINAKLRSGDHRLDQLDTGDGILLTDTANGSGTLTVVETGGGTTAADLQPAWRAVQRPRHADGQADHQRRQLGYEIDLTDLETSSGGVTPIGSLRSGQGVDSGVDDGIFDSIYGRAAKTVVRRRSDLGRAGRRSAFTVQDVIDKINASEAVGVTASISDAGTGITLSANTTGDDDHS